MTNRAVRVAIDVTSADDELPTGVARYIDSLLVGLSRQHVNVEAVARGAHAARRGQRRFRWSAPSNVDVFHGPDGRLPRCRRAAAVVTIHDLSAFDRRDHARSGFLRRKRRHLLRALARADEVITHTEVVRQRLHAEFGVALDRVHAIPLADALPQSAKQRELAERPSRLLTVGGPSRRKRSDRLPVLLESWRRELAWQPRVTWVGSGSMAMLEESLSGVARRQIDFLGHVSDSTLDACYREADGLLMLSDTEGFAMPLIEAANRACPVLAPRHELFDEVLDRAYCAYSMPPSASDFDRFLDIERRRSWIASAAERAAQFTWERTAEMTIEVYSCATRRCLRR